MSYLGKEVNNILIQCQQGDAQSFNLLMQKTWRHLMNITLRYIKDEKLAEVILNEAYFRAYTYIHAFNPKHDGYNWLCKIVQNEAFTYHAKEKQRREVRLHKVEHTLYTSDFTEELAERDEFDRIKKTFPDRDQSIITMYYYEGKTLEFIAKNIDMSLSGTQKRLNKLKNEISEKIKKSRKNQKNTSI